MFIATSGGTISEAVNRQLMEANGLGNPAATAIAAAIEALNANYLLTPYDARRAVLLSNKGSTASVVANAMFPTAALPVWTLASPDWTWA
jgi:hypothetical protein